MKKLLPVLFLVVSCIFPGRDYPTKQPTPPPDIEPVEEEGGQGFVIYAEPNDPDLESACLVEEIRETSGPWKIETQAVNFLWQTIDYSNSISIQRKSIDRADHIHAKKAVLHVSAGENFNFLRWTTLYFEDDLIAWGGPFPEDAYSIELDIDGAKDLKQYYIDGAVNVSGEVRGRAPKKDTWILVEVTFLLFYDCD